MRDGATVVFAISDAPVTFHAFARLFRDGLDCPNALFLDGSVSRSIAPELKRDDAPVDDRPDHQRVHALGALKDAVSGHLRFSFPLVGEGRDGGRTDLADKRIAAR